MCAGAVSKVRRGAHAPKADATDRVCCCVGRELENLGRKKEEGRQGRAEPKFAQVMRMHGLCVARYSRARQTRQAAQAAAINRSGGREG